MKKSIKLFTMLVSFLMIVSFLPACASYADADAVANEAVALASSYAKQLDGAWGDQHAELINMSKGDFAKFSPDLFAGYEDMRAVLCGFLAIRSDAGSNATYIYVLYPAGPIDSAPFFITVDASDPPSDYGTEHEWEAAFAAAWKGTPTAGSEAWEDEEGAGLLLSAYAPIHDSKGNVVALLGVDYPAR